MSIHQTSFRSACIEFAKILLLVTFSAFITGYVVGSLGGSREIGLVAAFTGTAMASTWWRRRRKARQAQHPG
ncbi:hypothetical protein [Massilia alkalitolerans]|uniref:hypothetical protein n=1 Tax=Massilia alkalitolerans TaxID=286638 RepID=UPI0028AF0B39|nr:hypothetical protein [Massilia alkalitolerans]